MKGKSEKMKLNKFLIVFLGILLFILIFIKSENQKGFLNFFSKEGDLNIKKIESIGIEGVKDAESYEDRAVFYLEDKLQCYDYEGDLLWEKEIVLKNYSVFLGDSNIYVYEKPTGYIQFIDQEGTIIKEMNLDEPIVGLKKEYDSMMVYTKKANEEKVYIIDKKTNVREVNDLGFEKILTYAISEDYTSYGISTLRMEDEKMGSRFTALKYGKNVLYRKDLPGEMILYTKFLDTHRVVIMTDKSIYLLNDFEGNTLWKKSYDLIKDIAVSDNKVNVLYGNTLETLSISGNVDSKYSFVDSYSRLISLDSFILVYGEEGFIALKDGEEIFKEKTKSKVVKAKSNKNKFLLVYEDKVDVYDIVK